MDRVHRIGQTKPVRVVRMVSADSIEDRILEIQEAKEALGKGALRKVSKRGVCCASRTGRQADPTTAVLKSPHAEVIFRYKWGNVCIRMYISSGLVCERITVASW